MAHSSSASWIWLLIGHDCFAEQARNGSAAVWNLEFDSVVLMDGHYTYIWSSRQLKCMWTEIVFVNTLKPSINQQNKEHMIPHMIKL